MTVTRKKQGMAPLHLRCHQPPCRQRSSSKAGLSILRTMQPEEVDIVQLMEEVGTCCRLPSLGHRCCLILEGPWLVVRLQDNS